MSFFSTIILGTEVQARAYSQTRTGIDDRDVFEFQNLTAIELSTLWALLLGKEWQAELLDHFNFLTPLTDGRDEIRVLPVELFERLAAFDFDLDEIARRWACTDEMRCEFETAQDLLQSLVDVALRIRKLRKTAHLWICG